MNPDAWVAQRNIERFQAGRTLDTLYLSTLSADATPTLVDTLPAEVTRCMFGLRDDARLRDDALAWNLGRDRAQEALEAPEVVGPIADARDCTQVITDDYR